MSHIDGRDNFGASGNYFDGSWHTKPGAEDPRIALDRAAAEAAANSPAALRSEIEDLKATIASQGSQIAELLAWLKRPTESPDPPPAAEPTEEPVALSPPAEETESPDPPPAAA